LTLTEAEKKYKDLLINQNFEQPVQASAAQNYVASKIHRSE